MNTYASHFNQVAWERKGRGILQVRDKEEMHILNISLCFLCYMHVLLVILLTMKCQNYLNSRGLYLISFIIITYLLQSIC